MQWTTEIENFLLANESSILTFFEKNKCHNSSKDKDSDTDNQVCSSSDLETSENEKMATPRIESRHISCSPEVQDTRSLFKSRRRYYQVAKKSRNFSRIARTNQNPVSKYSSGIVQPCRCVGIFGMSQFTDERDLFQIFREFGRIEKINIIRDRYNQRSRGFGFVYLRTVGEAENAIRKLSNAVIDGHKIRIDFSATDTSQH